MGVADYRRLVRGNTILNSVKKSGLRLDIDAAAVLFDDDVMAHRQAKPGTFAVNILSFTSGRDTGSVVTYPDFHSVCRGLLWPR
jgi:hypothetical protein